MSISRLLSLFIALILVVGVAPTVHAGIATSEVMSNVQNLSGCFQQPPGAASPTDTDTAAPDWVERHAASLTAAVPDWVDRYAASLEPANAAAPDWVVRYAASLKVGAAASNC